MRDELLTEPLPKATENTVVDRRILDLQLIEAGERGYAVSIAENWPNTCGVGAAILDEHGRPLAALSMLITEDKFDVRSVRGWGEQVRRAALSVTAALAP